MDPSDANPSRSHGDHSSNSSDLMGSAKIVAEAAKSTFSQETDKVDRARVAGAASDLLGAASHYGKLEEKSYGKYVEKAEDYLRQYGSPHTSSAAADGGHHPAPQHAEAPAAAAAPHHSSADSGGEEHSGSGGHGDYLKMAQGLLNSGGEDRPGSGGGFGEYAKMAEGFLKK